MSVNKEQDQKDDQKIEWFGIDGALCLTFVIEAIIIGYCMIHDVDLVIGKIVPYGVTLVTFLIFMKYVTQVLSFSRGVKKDDR